MMAITIYWDLYTGIFQGFKVLEFRVLGFI